MMRGRLTPMTDRNGSFLSIDVDFCGHYDSSQRSIVVVLVVGK